jgi:hypothetical protein
MTADGFDLRVFPSTLVAQAWSPVFRRRVTCPKSSHNLFLSLNKHYIFQRNGNKPLFDYEEKKKKS